MGRTLVLLIVGLAVLPAAGVEAQDTAATGLLTGSVVDSGGAPAPDVAVCIQETGRCDVTGPRGAFRLTEVRAGRYRLEITAAGAPPVVSDPIDVRAGLGAQVAVTLPALTDLRQTVTVRAPKFVAADELKSSAFLVTGDEIGASAGALQDVSRYVQSLPGAVIGTDDFRNDLIVRGGSPLENLYIVDNIEIPNINTFANFASAGGTVSILDAQLIQDVTFLTGGFPAAYGNRTSSVLQIAQREGSRERLAGRVTLGFAGAGGIAEGPIGRSGRGSWIVSARRSFLDLFSDDVGIGGVPVLYTVNGKAIYDLTPRDRLWVVNITGIDRIRLGLNEDSDLSDELSSLDIRYRGWRGATGVNWQRVFGTRGVGLLRVTFSTASVEQRVRDLLRNGVPLPGVPIEEQLANGETVFREDSSEAEATVKYDATVYLPVLEKLQAGASVKRFALDYDSASPFGSDGPYFRQPDQNPFLLGRRFSSYLTSGYVQGTRKIAGRVDLTAGARVDHYDYASITRVSPRGGVTVTLTPQVSVSASAGRYHQQPFFLFLAAFPENERLEPFRADHVVGGATWTPGDRTRLTVELYRKTYARYPVSAQIDALSLANIGDTFAVRDILFPMVSEGTGEARGVEIFGELKADAGSRWSGQANLSISRARHAGLDGIRRPGSFDYPVVANVVGGYRLSDRWRLSARASYLRGRPFTPFDPALSTAQRRAVYDLARVNAERTADYLRVDARVERTFTVNGKPFAVFFGAQNLTNRENIAGYSWDRRNNLPKVSTQLGLFPILGINWRL